MQYSLYQLLWLFFIYAFLGWCCEIGYCGLKEGHFVNRGFLNGPWCPIYGCGGVLIVLCLTPISNNMFFLFFGSLAICSAIEFLTGFVLEKIYRARWWDYSDKKFNIMGYICLEFSIIWGFFGIFLMKLIHPLIFGLVSHMSNIVGYICVCFVSAVFITDLVITVLTINKMQNMIKNADEISEKIRDATERIARNVYIGAVRVESISRDIAENEDVQEFIERTEMHGRVFQHRTDWQIAMFRAEHEDELEDLAEKLAVLKNKYTEFKTEHDENIDELRQKLAQLRTKYENVTKKKSILQSRIIKAFPRLDFKQHHDAFEKIKEKYKKK